MPVNLILIQLDADTLPSNFNKISIKLMFTMFTITATTMIHLLNRIQRKLMEKKSNKYRREKDIFLKKASCKELKENLAILQLSKM